MVMNILSEAFFDSFEEKIRANVISGKDIIMTMTVESTASAFNDPDLIKRVRSEKYDMFVAHALPQLRYWADLFEIPILFRIAPLPPEPFLKLS